MAKPKTRDQQVLEILLRIGEGSSADIIRQYGKDNQDRMTAEEMQVFCAGVHGSCSTLHDAGKIRRVRIDTNPTSGKGVYVYAVEQIQRAAAVKVEKTYKEKCAALEAELKSVRGRNEFMEGRIDQLVAKLKELGAYPL